MLRHHRACQSPESHTVETPQHIIARLATTAEPRARWHAIEHLAWWGRAAVPALSDALLADSVSVRRAAAQALGRIGPAARSADRRLLETLFDGERDLRSDAAWALVRIAPPLKAALPLLIGRLTAEESRVVQQGLLRLLGNIGPTAQPALALIYPKCDDPALFPAALYALRSIAPDDPLLLRVLYEQLIGAQAPFRALAAETVGKLRLNSPRWIAALRTATGSSDAQVRHAARTALARMRPFTSPQRREDSKNESIADAFDSSRLCGNLSAIALVERSGKHREILLDLRLLNVRAYRFEKQLAERRMTRHRLRGWAAHSECVRCASFPTITAQAHAVSCCEVNIL
jgi:hypothetical protein